ncbi:MAG: sulfatase-like hydrolase/transferase [Cyclobacteriaceae bacterium]
MKGIQFFLLLTVTVLVGGCSGKVQNDKLTNRAEKPNFLFIFSDDQRYNAIHALGDQTLQTPNLDRLVRGGVTFTHAFNMGAWHGAVCVASRAMMLTGLTVWEAKNAEAHFDSMAVQKKFWPQQLMEAGYETFMAGKWHVKVKTSDVFHHVVNVRPGMPKDSPEGYNRPQTKNDTLWQPWNTTYEGYWAGGKHWSEVLADDAIGFLKQAATIEKPFFMYLAFNAPHDPRQSPKEYVDKYPLEDIALPESYLDIYPYKDSIGCSPQLRDERLAPFPRTPHSVKTHIQEYYSIISHMDHQIGRILQALEESGKMDNTYVIFTSDHGLAAGNHGLLGKQNMFDHSVRVPLIIMGPGVEKGTKLSQQVYLQDIMPTTYELAGIKKNNQVRFNSLIPYVTGQLSESVYPSIYGCYMDLQRMVRTQEHKLIVYPTARKVLLFDLKKDPYEKTDLSAVPEYKEVLKSLIVELQRQQKVLNDPLDLTPFFREISAL